MAPRRPLSPVARRVALVHATADRAWVAAFAACAQAGEPAVSVEPWPLEAGADLMDRVVRRGIGHLDALVLLVSRASLGQGWLEAGLRATALSWIRSVCPVVVLVVDDADVPPAARRAGSEVVSVSGAPDAAVAGLLDGLGLGTTGAEQRSTRPDAVLAGLDLFKIYRDGAGDYVALRGATVAVGRGEFVTLMGPSGSGKTTLVSLLAGLSVPSAGTVWVDGRELSSLGEAGRAEVRAHRIGLVFQHTNLVPFLTARENVMLAIRDGTRRVASGRADELLAELGVADRAQHRPPKLSGGEAQRVAIAVALANDPAVLIGDEVTGELDTATAHLVVEALRRVQQDRQLALLLVTHNADIASRADQALVMSDGQLTS
jgi:putative ABC transport system ATP-binding protein